MEFSAGRAMDADPADMAQPTPGLLGAAFDLLQEGLLLLDDSGRVVAANQSACLLLGVDHGSLLRSAIGDRRPDVLGPDGRPLAAEDYPAAVTRRTGQPTTAVIGLRRAGGDTTWLHLTAAPIAMDAPGSDLSLLFDATIMVTFTDISDRVIAEHELRNSEQRFRLTFADAPIGMAIVSLDGTMLQANAAFAEMLGRTTTDLLGRTFQELTHPDDLTDNLELLNRLLGGEISGYQIQKRYLHTSGDPVWARLTATLVRDAEGEPMHLVSQVEDISEVREAQARLEYRALYDDLTGLANRWLLLERLEDALGECERTHGRVAVVYLDLDHFKRINDSLGHRAGDELLRLVGRRLESSVRPGDTVARLGGDEFVLVLPAIRSIDHASQLLRGIMANLHRPLVVHGHEVLPAASAGLAVSDGRRSAEEVLHDADTALYAAKDHGRARWEVFDEAVRAKALLRLSTEEGLRAGLGRSELVVHYQPIVDLRSGQVDAYEALVRWQHPRRGLLMPDEFIPISEEANLIGALGTFVLREACEFVTERPDFTGRVCVNISPHQFSGSSLSATVRAVLDETGVSGDRLILEITESSVLHPTAETTAEMAALVDLGATLVLDDFGTGYSPLSAVLVAPVKGLKLDRSFTMRLGDGGVGDRISAALAGLVVSLGAYGVVEGIETQQQRETAIRHRWTHGQGWLFGRPAPATRLTPPG